MATSFVRKGVDPSGTPISTYSHSEDAITKEIQRVAFVDDSGRLLSNRDSNNNPGTPVTVTNSAGIVVPANTARHGVIIWNNGANNCFFGFGSGLTSSNGIVLPIGGQYIFQGFGVFRGDIYCITASSTTSVRFQEW